MSRIAYQNTPLTTEKRGQGVFVFRGAGGNVTAIAGSDGCAVIDTGYGPRVDEMKHGIASALSQIPDWLVNTHWHFDHTDGNQAFVAAGATILAHTNCRVRLSHDQYVPSLEWAVEASPRIAWPTITIDGPGAIDLGLETLQFIPQSAAHTDGDLAMFLPSSNVLITGDLFINGSYPLIDASAGGTLRGMIEALARLTSIANTDTMVVYLSPADNVPGPLSTRLRRVYQPVFSIRNLFSTPHTSLLTSICIHFRCSPSRLSTSTVSQTVCGWGHGGTRYISTSLKLHT
jgi:cyclase